MKKIILTILFITIFNSSYSQQKVEFNNQFNSIELSGNMKVELIDDTVCRIEASSYDIDIQKLNWSQKGDVLRIISPSGVFDKGEVFLKIQVNNLQNLLCDGVEVISTTPLTSQNLTVYALSSDNKIDLTLDVEKLTINANGKNTIKVNGYATWADLKVTMGARVDAINATFDNCDVLASGGAEVIVNVAENLNAQAKSKASIFYKGNPTSSLKSSTWGEIVPIPKY